MPKLPSLEGSDALSVVSAMNNGLAHHIADVVVLRLQANLTSIERQLEVLTGQVQNTQQRRTSTASLTACGMVQQTPAEQRARARSSQSSLSIPMLNKTKQAVVGASVQTAMRDFAALPELSDQSSDEEQSDIEYDSRRNSRALEIVIAREETGEHEPEHTGPLASCVGSGTFGYVSLLVILINTAFVFFTTDYAARTLKPEQTWMLVCESLFLGYYTVELILKLIVHKKWFFCNEDRAWNIFDFVVVSSGIVQSLVEELTDSKSMDLTFLRVLRILRIGRILRVFRVVKFFEELRFMTACLVSSLGSLFWVTMFLGLMLMMVSLVFVQGMTHFRIDQGVCDSGPCTQIPDLFGSVSRTMVVLFECTTGGTDWGDIFEIVQLTGELNSILFILYILFFLFAFFNIIMSLFVDKALKFSQPDEFVTMMQKRDEEMKLMKDLQALLNELDVDKSGTITSEELHSAAAESEEVHAKFDEIGISLEQAQVFFHVASSASKSDELFISDFVGACIKMKGPAWGIDVQGITFQLLALQQHLGMH